jgi:hypothetical protein
MESNDNDYLRKDSDYLNDNLLDENEDDLLPPMPITDEPPKQPLPLTLPLPLKRPSTLDLGRNRLVIAIDYGTTFTGKLCYLDSNA